MWMKIIMFLGGGQRQKMDSETEEVIFVQEKRKYRKKKGCVAPKKCRKPSSKIEAAAKTTRKYTKKSLLKKANLNLVTSEPNSHNCMCAFQEVNVIIKTDVPPKKSGPLLLPNFLKEVVPIRATLIKNNFTFRGVNQTPPSCSHCCVHQQMMHHHHHHPPPPPLPLNFYPHPFRSQMYNSKLIKFHKRKVSKLIFFSGRNHRQWLPRIPEKLFRSTGRCSMRTLSTLRSWRLCFSRVATGVCLKSRRRLTCGSRREICSACCPSTAWTRRLHSMLPRPLSDTSSTGQIILSETLLIDTTIVLISTVEVQNYDAKRDLADISKRFIDLKTKWIVIS